MSRERIDICICTFRRPSLDQTLASIAGQVLPEGVTLHVIVADNDSTDWKRAHILDVAERFGLDLHYVHAPEQNISIARNACLDAASCNSLVFIDDDEVASPDWIAQLLAHRAHAEIVFGVSQARYPDPQTPQWVIAGDFHSNRISGNDAPWNGYTANVLIDRCFVAAAGLRFAPELGRVGGEDTRFFLEAYQAGARFGYAPSAVVWEDTPLKRTRLRWLALRRFRAGQVHFLLSGTERQGRHRLAFTALAKAAACFGGAGLKFTMPLASRRSALRGMLHLGVVASYFGFSPYEEYGGAPPV